MIMAYSYGTPLQKKYLPNLKQIKSDFEAFSRPFKIAKISIKKIFKKSVYEQYEKQLTEKLSLNNDSLKLFLYTVN